MSSLPLRPNALTTLESIASAPILIAFMIGTVPVLIPLLLYRWIARRV